jgi:hypothetical protein
MITKSFATAETDNTFDSLKFDTDWNWPWSCRRNRRIEGEDRFSRFNQYILQSCRGNQNNTYPEEIVEADRHTKYTSI